jgi:hypothetical protein
MLDGDHKALVDSSRLSADNVHYVKLAIDHSPIALPARRRRACRLRVTIVI